MTTDGDPVVRQQPDSPETDAAGEEWLEHWRRGPKRTRWSELPPQAGDAAPTVDLAEARSGQMMPLSSVWEDGPALLLFWRHYGCSCGRERAERLRSEYETYIAASARVALVGQGEPERALVYAAANKLPAGMPLFCDPDERAYRAFGLLEGGPIEVLFDAPDEYLRCEPAAGASLFKERRDAGRPMVDNPWLLPGEFVVDRDGRIVTAFRFAFCEHWIDPRVNVAAIRSASGELQPTFASEG